MLNIVNKSPQATCVLDSALRVAQSGGLLLIEDGVYAATKGNTSETRLRDAMAQLKIYALLPDLEARGVADRLIEGVTPIDYAGFVDLVVEYPNSQSWL